MAEEIKATEPKSLPSKIKVKNIWPNTIVLENGPIEPDKTGDATPSEYENMVGRYLEKVG